MAGDKKGEQRKVIGRQGDLAQNNLNNLRTDTLIPQNQQMWNNYQNATGQAGADYNNIMGQYQNFAKTGGYSPGDISNIRSRAVSPLRSVYANANRDVDRQRSLQGGYSPGYSTMKGRLAREMSSGLSDASTNAEGMIAQMIQQGKLHGMAGQSNMYSATPGMANMYGQQALASTGQRLQGEGLQGNLSMGMINAHQNAQQLPGKWEGTLGRIGDVAQLGTSILSPWMGGGMGLPGTSNPMGGNINSGMYGYPTMPKNQNASLFAGY